MGELLCPTAYALFRVDAGSQTDVVANGVGVFLNKNIYFSIMPC